MQQFIFPSDTAEAQVACFVLGNFATPVELIFEELSQFSEVEVKAAISTLLERGLVKQTTGLFPWSELANSQ